MIDQANTIASVCLPIYQSAFPRLTITSFELFPVSNALYKTISASSDFPKFKKQNPELIKAST